MAKKEKKTYEIAVGLKKGHKVTKNERKKPRPSQLKGVSINKTIIHTHIIVYVYIFILYIFFHICAQLLH